ncbi:RluA family pseudouridine synthase [Candidatus Poribacteria bacterium]|nr:RluA family pseudouridine synthase [Candidatus Poribacteria bacterium]
MSRLPVPQKLYEFAWQPEWSGLRTREVLAKTLTELPSRAGVLAIANGLVSAGGAVLDDLDSPVPEGAALTVDLRHGFRGEGKPRHPKLKDQVRVLHDDEDLVVVSKAAGVIVQPVPDEQEGEGRPLVELLKHYWKSRGAPAVNPIVVQRLDKLTSGLLVLAKTVPAGRHLQRQAGGRFMERRYVALVEGKLARKLGTWKNVIGKGPEGFRQVVGEWPEEDAKLPPGSSRAVTHFRVLEEFEGFSLLELKLETGRTHQIRVHCAEAGHPVAGDPVYLKLARMRFPGIRTGKTDFPRMMLHAERLKFQHPSQEARWLTFEDPPPAEMREAIERIRQGRKPRRPGRKGGGGKRPNGAL